MKNKKRLVTKETREKLRKSGLNRKHSEKTKLKISISQKGKHHSEETKKKLSELNKGEKNAFYGKKHSLKTKKKMSKSRKKRITTNETKQRMSIAHKGKVISKETRQKLHFSQLGKKGSNWKGGITPLLFQIRTCFKYRQWRSDVFTRDNFTCQKCGKTTGPVNAHHIKQFITIFRDYNIKSIEEALFCEELWNINNGITYCIKCHNIIHKRKVKDETPNL